MPTVEVRDIPEHIDRALNPEARQNRSLSEQVVVTLAKGLGLATNQKQRHTQLLAEIGGSEPINWAFDPVAAIREDRNR